MPEYIVHLFPIVRVKCQPVEAESMEEAIVLAEGGVDLERMFSHEGFERGEEDIEYTEDIEYYLVDVVGDEEYAQSRSLKFDGQKFVCAMNGCESGCKCGVVTP